MKHIVTTDTAIEMLHQGSIGVMPTDTVYGLVARAYDKKAVARLYALKQREHKPGSIVANNIEQVLALGTPKESIEIVKQWWPGPLSAVLPVSDQLAYLHQGVGDIAIRVVATIWLQNVLEQTGPLLTSSANQPGQPSSINAKEAWDYFHEDVDFYVDGGELSTERTSSTIIKIGDNGEVEILRQGVVYL